MLMNSEPDTSQVEGWNIAFLRKFCSVLFTWLSNAVLMTSARIPTKNTKTQVYGKQSQFIWKRIHPHHSNWRAANIQLNSHTHTHWKYQIHQIRFLSWFFWYKKETFSESDSLLFPSGARVKASQSLVSISWFEDWWCKSLSKYYSYLLFLSPWLLEEEALTIHTSFLSHLFLFKTDPPFWCTWIGHYIFDSYFFLYGCSDFYLNTNFAADRQTVQTITRVTTTSKMKTTSKCFHTTLLL